MSLCISGNQNRERFISAPKNPVDTQHSKIHSRSKWPSFSTFCKTVAVSIFLWQANQFFFSPSIGGAADRSIAPLPILEPNGFSKVDLKVSSFFEKQNKEGEYEIFSHPAKEGMPGFEQVAQLDPSELGQPSFPSISGTNLASSTGGANPLLHKEGILQAPLLKEPEKMENGALEIKEYRFLNDPILRDRTLEGQFNQVMGDGVLMTPFEAGSQAKALRNKLSGEVFALYQHNRYDQHDIGSYATQLLSGPDNFFRVPRISGIDLGIQPLGEVSGGVITQYIEKPQPVPLAEVSDLSAQKMAVLDLLIQNQDRSPANRIYRMNQETNQLDMIPIDHDLAMPYRDCDLFSSPEKLSRSQYQGSPIFVSTVPLEKKSMTIPIAPEIKEWVSTLSVYEVLSPLKPLIGFREDLLDALFIRYTALRMGVKQDLTLEEVYTFCNDAMPTYAARALENVQGEFTKIYGENFKQRVSLAEMRERFSKELDSLLPKNSVAMKELLVSMRLQELLKLKAAYEEYITKHPDHRNLRFVEQALLDVQVELKKIDPAFIP